MPSCLLTPPPPIQWSARQQSLCNHALLVFAWKITRALRHPARFVGTGRHACSSVRQRPCHQCLGGKAPDLGRPQTPPIAVALGILSQYRRQGSNPNKPTRGDLHPALRALELELKPCSSPRLQRCVRRSGAASAAAHLSGRASAPAPIDRLGWRNGYTACRPPGKEHPQTRRAARKPLTVCVLADPLRAHAVQRQHNLLLFAL